jgi:outer membrane receptor protein involved in Fe transport
MHLKRMHLGGFVQDSWSIAKGLVTLNAGIRYDSQWMYTEDGRLAVALRHQLSPRVGLVVDPLHNGRMRLFAHYAKYHGQMPFELVGLGGLEAPGVSELVPTSSSELVAGAEKAFGSRELFLIRKYLSLDLGLAYQGRSGTPIVLSHGSTGERTPWVHSIDPHLEVRYRVRKNDVVSFSLDVFNLFNFQEVTLLSGRAFRPRSPWGAGWPSPPPSAARPTRSATTPSAAPGHPAAPAR